MRWTVALIWCFCMYWIRNFSSAFIFAVSMYLIALLVFQLFVYTGLVADCVIRRKWAILLLKTIGCTIYSLSYKVPTSLKVQDIFTIFKNSSLIRQYLNQVLGQFWTCSSHVCFINRSVELVDKRVFLINLKVQF